MSPDPLRTDQYATFNVNNTVRVKLTPIGRAELVRQHEELRKAAPSLGDFQLRVDSEGFSEFQLWDLMESLGHLCGCGRPVPFETDVHLLRKDIR